MSTKRNLWTKGPYGEWVKATTKPVDLKDAKTLADAYQAGSAELKVCIVPVNVDPNEDL